MKKSEILLECVERQICIKGRPRAVLAGRLSFVRPTFAAADLVITAARNYGSMLVVEMAH